MDDQSAATGLLKAGGDPAGDSVQADFRRARRRLGILLSLYAAVTAYAVLLVLVALPLLLYLDRIEAIELAGDSDFVIKVFTPFAMPSAVALALGMRYLLQNMLHSGSVSTAHERSALYELILGLALLNTVFLALPFMRPINWPLLWRGIQLAVIAAASIAGMGFLLASFEIGERGDALFLLVGFSSVAVAMIAAVLIPALQLLFSLRNRRLAAVASGTAAGLAAAAGAMAFAVVTPLLRMLGSTESAGLLILLLILILIPILMLPAFSLLLLPPLLRARASHARLRYSLNPSPAACQYGSGGHGGVRFMLPLYAAATAAVMTAVFVVMPLYLYVLADGGTDFAGLGIFVIAVLFSPLIPGAVLLALNMRAVLNRLHLQGAPGRDAQAGIMLMFSGRLPIWLAVVSALLLACAALVVNYLLVLFLLFPVPILYLVAFAAAGLALAVSMAAALRRMLLKRRDKWILKIALLAVACATASMAAMAGLSVTGILELPGGIGNLPVIWEISILLQILGFLLLPRLLRASDAYALLRHAGGSAPGG